MAEKQDSLDVLKARMFLMCRGDFTYLTGHESLAGAGWAENQNNVDMLTPKRSLM